MGWLGRSLGDFGSQIGQATDIRDKWKQDALNASLTKAKIAQDQLMGPLQLEELKGRIANQDQERNLAGWGTFSTKRSDGGEDVHYYNKLTGEDRVVSHGTSAPVKYTSFRQDNDGKLWGFNEQAAKEEPIPGAEGASFKKQNVTPDIKSFGGFDWQYDPDKHISGQRNSTGDWVRLGVSKAPKANGGEGNLDAYVMDLSRNGGNLPGGKFGAAVAQRAKEMGVAIAPYDKVKVAAAKQAEASARAAYTNSQKVQADTAKHTSWWRPGTYGSAEAGTLTDQAQNDYEQKRLSAITAYQEAGLSVPGWLTAGQSADPTHLPGVTEAK